MGSLITSSWIAKVVVTSTRSILVVPHSDRQAKQHHMATGNESNDRNLA